MATILLIACVNVKPLLRFTYGDKVRVAELHVEKTVKGGKKQIVAYQHRATYPGETYPAPETGWRTFDVAKMTNVEVLG